MNPSLRIPFLRAVLMGMLVLVPDPAVGDEGIVLEYEKEEKSEKEGFLGVEKIFNNPALASGLDSGARSLNRSLDSIMEAVFYSIMDNELIYDVTDQSLFKATLTRNLHNTRDGNYVVVDRFSLGPEFSTPLTPLQRMNLNLGASQNVNVINIYLRNDGIRLAENQSVGFWRWSANNWLGLLPVLTYILPPSFNQNELYDPVRELETPFIFPFSVEAVRDMSVGNVRSYSFSGGINLGVNIMDARFMEQIRDIFERNDVDSAIPYSIYKTGEHRINVLRRSENHVWVGLTNTDKTGHGLAANMGKIYLVFNKVASYWSGVPAPVIPVSISATDAAVHGFDLLFEYNLTNPLARKAYRAAVRGKFQLSYEMHEREAAREADPAALTTGVRFHFERVRTADEVEFASTRNLFVHRDSRGVRRTKSRIKTKDEGGLYTILESKLQIEDSVWDVLVGADEVNFFDQVRMKVREIPGAEAGSVDFEFVPGDPNPMSLVLALNTNDRFVDMFDFRRVVRLQRYFTGLPMATIPRIPTRSPQLVEERRRKGFLMNPEDDVASIRVTPTFRGRMVTDSSMVLNTQQLRHIFSLPEKRYWQAFARAYGLEPQIWETEERRDSFRNTLWQAGAFILYPLHTLNVRIPLVDALTDSAERIEALKRLSRMRTPAQFQEGFNQLLSTDYPARLAHTLRELASGDIPRSVSFTTKPKGKANPGAKKLFASLNRKVFRSTIEMPVQERHLQVREKLAAFVPTEMQESRERPQIGLVHVLTRAGFEENGQNDSDAPLEKHLYVRLRLHKQLRLPVKIYVRFEQGGKVNVGRFVLAEKVLTLAPQKEEDGKGQEEYEYGFFLSGPLNSLDFSYFSEAALDLGGKFILSLAASLDGEVWSQEKKISFRFDEGRLSEDQDDP